MTLTRHYEGAIRAELEQIEDEIAALQDRANEKKSLLQMLMTTLIYIGGKPQKIVKKSTVIEYRESRKGNTYPMKNARIPIIYVKDK
jgi:hypothetical protein